MHVKVQVQGAGTLPGTFESNTGYSQGGCLQHQSQHAITACVLTYEQVLKVEKSTQKRQVVVADGDAKVELGQGRQV
jgi:hypothetical protein